MKIGITTKYPEVFVLALATLFKQAGSVNIHTNGEYSDLLFYGSDENQERNGIHFNAEGDFEYEFFINGSTLCDHRILHIRPYYRDIVELKRNYIPAENHVLVISEPFPPGLKYGHRLILSELNLPQTEHYEIPLDERDLLMDYHFGMQTNFNIERFSKPYRDMLLNIFNSCNGTTYTKFRHIKNKPLFNKKRPEEVSEATEEVL